VPTGHRRPYLLTSRFAGAANELDAALLVNPYDTEAVAGAIARALSMPLDERRVRHEALYRALLANDIRFWTERFLTALTRPRSHPTWLRPVSTLVS